MNLLAILESRIEDLPEGDYIQGIKSILQHIEVAGRHLERGHSLLDDTAFTDAIYRTNQAFEGSLKEAYRVLAAKDPAGETPFNIENYLQQQNVLRPRVLAQFTNYRKEWRNPSTHDYRLDFDEDEALLAIVTVSAFAIVLVDQIIESISYEQAKIIATEQPVQSLPKQSLLKQVDSLLEQFVVQFNKTHAGRVDLRETEIIGALGGFLAVTIPDYNIQIESFLTSARNARADFVINSGQENLILELKRGRGENKRLIEDATQQVMRYMQMSNINQAILFIYNSPNNGEITRVENLFADEDSKLMIINVR